MIMFSLEHFLISQGKKSELCGKGGKEKLGVLLTMICKEKMKIDNTVGELGWLLYYLCC